MAIVKKLKQHPPLPPSRYEVGIYCRVSTESKTQIVSVGHQLSGLIADVANSYQARLYDVYLDIQSGRTSDNRKNLMRLLDDCRTGRVSLVYTKSISRSLCAAVFGAIDVRSMGRGSSRHLLRGSRVGSPNTSFNLTLSLGRITISPG